MVHDQITHDLVDPLPIMWDPNNPIDWSASTDVIVVGFGCAGACAALQAREEAAEVIVVDRFQGGGATRYSGGVLYAGGTRFQRDAGIHDSAEEMYKYLNAEIGHAVSPQLLRDYCDTSASNLEWLVRHGVEFSGEAMLEKTSYPPDGKFLYFSGNENRAEFASLAIPAPRGHRTVGEGLTGSRLFAQLKAATEREGIRFLGHTSVSGLVIDEHGRVIGIEALTLPADKHREHERLFAVQEPLRPFNSRRSDRAGRKSSRMEAKHGTKVYIRANKGVVITAGGFINNREMIERHHKLMARTYPFILRLGGLGDTGAGISIGRSCGGAVRYLDQFVLAGPFFPPNTLLEGVLVDKEGARVIDETSYSGDLGRRVLDLPEGSAWLIIDGHMLASTLKEIFFPAKGMFKYFMLPALLNLVFGGTKFARTLPKLAERCRINKEGLVATIRQYNEDAAQGRDKMGKKKKYLKPLRGIKVAINLGLTNRFLFRQAMTVGGLVVDDRSGAVLKDDGAPIPGLYAAGRSAAGICSGGYLSGLSLGDCVFSGRRAGKHVSANVAVDK